MHHIFHLLFQVPKLLFEIVLIQILLDLLHLFLLLSLSFYISLIESSLAIDVLLNHCKLVVSLFLFFVDLHITLGVIDWVKELSIAAHMVTFETIPSVKLRVIHWAIFFWGGWGGWGAFSTTEARRCSFDLCESLLVYF